MQLTLLGLVLFSFANLLPLIGYALIALAIIAIGFGVYSIIDTPRRNAEAAEKESQLRDKIAEIVENNIETLARRRLQLLKTDPYGVTDTTKWNKEVRRFIDNVLKPKLTDSERHFERGLNQNLFQEIIETKVSAKANALQHTTALPDSITPIEFERWCSSALKAIGWNVTTTKASGDQGADVLADKYGFHIVLQCKLYSSPVGNKAVQEAFAAQRHYSANASAVVTNADYTPAARELANTTKVHLLHHSDLSRLDEMLALYKDP